jgi:DNA primase RepB-like protein
MGGVDRHAPVRFLRTVFEPTDWVAVFLKSYDRGGVAQRVGPASWVQSERFQQWLLALNAQKYNVFVSVNAIASGRHSRTRDAIGTIRHVFLDADCDGPAVLSSVEARRDVPSPSYVMNSSPGRLHLFWRVRGFDGIDVERLQKQLACELHSDPAATPITQNMRLPGFFYLKSPVAGPCGTARISQGLTYAAVTHSRRVEARYPRPRASSFSPGASFVGVSPEVRWCEGKSYSVNV